MPDPANDPDITDITDLSQQLRTGIGRVYRRFRALRAHGELGDAALSVLTRLRKAGDQSLTALSEEAHVTPSSMSQVVNRLERGGYLARHPDPVDGRRVLFRLTETGRRTEQASIARSRSWFDAQLAAATPEERAALARAAEILLRISAAEDPAPGR